MGALSATLDDNTYTPLTSIKEGYLMKESKYWKEYRCRWMVLRGTSLLSYNKDISASNSTASFDLSEYTYLELNIVCNQFSIISSSNAHSCNFKAQSTQEMLEWVQCIEKVQYNNRVIEQNEEFNPIIYDIKCKATSTECIVKWNVFISYQDLQKIKNYKLFMKIKNIKNDFHKTESQLIEFDVNNIMKQYECKLKGLKTETLYKMEMIMFTKILKSMKPMIFQFKTEFNSSDFINDRYKLLIPGYLREIKNICFEEAISNIIYAFFNSNTYKKPFIYKYDYDENGICYYLGTHFGTQKWVNPAKKGLIKLYCNSRWGSKGCLNDMVERALCYSYIVDCNNSYSGSYLYPCITIDFGTTFKIKPNYYTLMHSGGWDLRYWNFEGSNDTKHWNILKQHRNDKTLRRRGQSHSWRINNCNRYFRYFRIEMTDDNSGGERRFTCIGFEIYGYLSRTIK